MEEQKSETKKCSYCKVFLPLYKYSLKRNDEYKKCCDECLAKKKIDNKKYYENNREQISEQHKKRYEENKDQILERNRKYREQNREQILEHHADQVKCEHSADKYYCKICTDPVKVTIKLWIKASRQYDKKSGLYDPNHFIDTDFLKGLIEDSNNLCIYCKCEMQFLEKTNNMCTIERVNNNLGHTKANCVLACFGCNCERGNRHTFEEFIALKSLQLLDE
jgi:hypothetical protein